MLSLFAGMAIGSGLTLGVVVLWIVMWEREEK